jgi:hypothetical protein
MPGAGTAGTSATTTTKRLGKKSRQHVTDEVAPVAETVRE